ncbi:MAG: hypothetical protein ACI943_001427 [Gammaproteobacteria bacterium]|jgi:hypothetical protein
MKSAIAFLLGFGYMISAYAQMMYPGEVTITGDKETVFDWSTDNCSMQMSVDGTPRVFRDADGQIQLINMHTTAFRMVGDDFDNLQIDCSAPILDSDWDDDPAKFNSAEWLGSTWTEDGETVYGLVHSEWHAYDYEGQCLSSDIMKCWYNGITLVESVDSGRTFSHLNAPDHLVASVPYVYDATLQSRQGAFGPSNIVKNPNDGLYYCLFYTEENVNGTTSYEQGGGTCVMRTADLSDPKSWRIFDGNGYNTTSVNPYTENFVLEDHLFYNIGMGKQMASLTYNTYFDMWMLVGPSAKYNREEDRYVRGFYYQLSDNLIDWTGLKLIVEMNFPDDSALNNSSLDEYGMYPTIIDHNDPSRNFMYSDQDCHLYYTVWNTYPSETSGSPNRNLVRVPIHFSKAYVSSFTIDGKGTQYDANPGDGVCATESGKCNLHALIQESNARLPRYADSVLTVHFDVSGPKFNIQNSGGTINDPVFFDAWTEPDAAVNSLSIDEGFNTQFGVVWEFNGNPAITFNGGQSGMRGIVIKGQNGPAVTFTTEGNNVIEGCWLGTSSDGLSNEIEDTGGTAIEIIDCDNNRIGGLDPSQRNILLGPVNVENSDNNAIQGNYFGLSADGTASIDNNGNTALSIINSANNKIGGVEDAARNIFAGGYNGTIAIQGEGSWNSLVLNNYFGINAIGTEAIGTCNSAISIYGQAHSNYIGALGSGNTIGSLSTGVAHIILEGSTHDNYIQGNYIGVNTEGSSLVPDEDQSMAAIYLNDGANNNWIGGTEGQGNTIAYSRLHGILLLGSAGNGNTIQGNSIYGISGMGIDIGFDGMTQENDYMDEDDGPNTALNYPDLETAFAEGSYLELSGSMHSIANTPISLEYFVSESCGESGYGPGKILLGSQEITTDAEGNSPINFNYQGDMAFEELFYTAIATDQNGNSSEFSSCISTSVPSAEIAINPQQIDESGSVGSDIDIALAIENDGFQELDWTLESDEAWISFSASSGTESPSGGSTIYISFDVSAFAEGEHFGTITLSSNDPDESTINIPVNLNLSAEPILTFEPSSFEISQNINSMVMHSIAVQNDGMGDLSWALSAPIEVSWIYSGMPNNGVLPAGQSDQLFFNINTQGLSEGTYNSEVVINSNASNASFLIIPVTLIVGENNATLSVDLFVDQFGFCQSEQTEVNFTGTGVAQPGNTYLVKLSDENGSFTTPYTVGQTSTTTTNGTISIQIPSDIPTGNGYKLSIQSTNPPSGNNVNPNDIYVHPWVNISAPELGSACTSSGPQALPQGTPSGGYWEGPGVDNNTFDPNLTGIGDFQLNYVYQSPEMCVFKAQRTLTVYNAASVTLEESGPFCTNSIGSFLVAYPTGGQWSGEGIQSNMFSPMDAGAGTHELTYTYGMSQGCASNTTMEVIVYDLPEVSASQMSAVCIGTETIELDFALPVGGEYWGTWIENNAFNLQASGPGNFEMNYTYISTEGCSNSTTIGLEVLSLPTNNIGLETSYCANEEPVYLSAQDESIIEVSGPGIMENVFYPGMAEEGENTLHIIIEGSNGCILESNETVHIKPVPEVSLALPDSLCSSDPLFDLSSGNPLAGIYAVNGTISSSINPGLLTPGAHEVTYFYENDFFCMGVASESIWVTESPDTPTITFDGIFLSSNIEEGLQWYLNDDLIPGADSNSHMPSTGGIYTAKAMNNNCASDMSNEIEVNITQIGETSDSQVRVYPNPFDSRIIVDAGTRWSDETEFRLYSETGALVRFAHVSEVQYSNGKYLYHEGLDAIKPGIYFLLILEGENTHRAVLQKR